MVGAQGQEKWAKVALKDLYLWRQSQKIRNPNQKFFFECKLQDLPRLLRLLLGR